MRKRGVLNPPVLCLLLVLTCHHVTTGSVEKSLEKSGFYQVQKHSSPIHQSVPLACSHGKLLRISVGACFVVISPELPPNSVLVLVLDFDGRHFLVVEKG